MKTMHRVGTTIFALVAIVACDTATTPEQPSRTADLSTAFTEVTRATIVDQRFILVADRGAERRVTAAGFEIVGSLAEGSVLIVSAGDADQAAALADLPGVRAVTKDFAFTLDAFSVTEFTRSAAPHASPSPAGLPEYWDLQWEKPQIGIPEAHDIATGVGTRIAIIDTGIQPGHPDLTNLNEDLSVAFIGGERIAAGEPIDVSGHGTMVAGIAAAQGVGVLGTAPDAELVSIRVFGEEGGFFASDVLLALEYAAEIDADVANLSLGTVPLPAEVNAGGIRGAIERVVNGVVRQGTVVTAAGGNSAADLQHGGEWASYTSMAGTIGASATGADDLLTFYSNYGTNAIDVAAPGGGMADAVDSYCGVFEYFVEGRIVEPGEETEVCFLYPDEPFPVPTHPDNAEVCLPCTAPERPFPLNGILSTLYNPIVDEHGYDWQGGTSFAAPHVAGLVALVRELEPGMHPRRVENAIKQGAENSTGRSDPALGAGRINALDTLRMVQRSSH